MMILTYSLLGISVFIIIRHDIRTQTIPLYALLAFSVATLLQQFQDPTVEGIKAAVLILAIFGGCQGVFFIFTRFLAMGWADLLLAPLCGVWLYLHEVPTFLTGTGILALLTGIVWRYRWKMRTFPMAPAILSSWALVLLIRCFLTMNRIWV